MSSIDNESEVAVHRHSEKAILKNSEKFTGKYLFHSLFFTKVEGLKPAIPKVLEQLFY